MTLTNEAALCPAGRHRRAASTKGSCRACKRDDATARAVGVLRGLLPEADVDAITAAVSAVAATSDRAAAIADHFSAQPDAVTSGASSGPLVALRVLNALIAAGVTGVSPPRCVTCRRPQRHFVTVVDNGRQCCDCRQAVLREPCVGCGRVTKVAARPERGPLCQRCWAHDPASWRPCGLCATVGRKAGTMAGIQVGACCYVPPAVRCTMCGLAKGVHPYKTRRPVCRGCQTRTHVACSICQRPAARPTDGADAVCALCSRHPAQRCVGCGIWTSTRDRSRRPRCLDCYTRQSRPCGRCGKLRPVVRLATGDDPELCGLCWRGPIAVCEHCGKTRPCRGERRGELLCAACAPRSREPCIRCERTRTVAARLPTGSICAACYQTFLRARAVCPACGDLRRLLDHPDHPTPVCSDCCNDRDRQICERCNTEDALPRGGRCTRCALTDALDKLLGDEHQRAVNGMQPVHDALTSLTRYRNVYELLTRPPATAADLLHHVAIGEIARTHEAFAELPQQRTTIAVEALLTVAGVLPPCDLELVRLERWIDRYLAAIGNPDHQRVLRRYATWHVLARARRNSPLSDTGRHSRIHRLRIAHRFLDWLADRHVTLTACRQVDLDDWTLCGPATSNDARAFITWAQRQRLLPAGLELPTRSANTASPVIVDDERWTIARALLHDDGYPLDVRVAGLLACLYAQPLTRVVTLTADDITATDDGVTIRLGTTPIDVPEPFATHLVALRDRHHHTSLVKSTGTTRWLFPGHNPGRPRTVTPLAKKLRSYGIRVSNQRTAAFAHLAVSMPAAIVADLLGISINTATRWAEHTRRDWTDYLVHRSEATSPNGQPNTAAQPTYHA